MNPNPLPKGKYLRLPNLPFGTTEEELHEFFKAHGIDVGPECFSVKEFPNGASALFSAPDELLTALLKWAIGGDEFNGCQIEFLQFGSERIQRRA